MTHGRLDNEDTIGAIYDRKLMGRLFGYAKPYRSAIVLSIVLIIASSLLELAWPQFIRIAIDDYVLEPSLSEGEKATGILQLAGLFLATLIGSVILEYWRIVVMSLTGQRVLHDVRMDLFRHVEGLAMSFFTRQPVGRLVTRLTNDVNQLSELFTTGIVGIYGDVIMLSGILVLMATMHVRLTLLTLIVLPLIALSAAMFRRSVRPAYLDIRRNIARVNTFVQEHVSGIRVVQAFNREEATVNRFNELNRDHLNSMKRMVRAHAVFMPVVDLFSNCAIAVLLGFGAVFIYQGSLKMGMLIAFLMYSRRFYRPVMDLSQKYNILQDAMTASARIFDLLDRQDRIEEQSQSPEDTPIRELQGAVTFSNVSFSYVPGEMILKNISFSVQPGEKIALVGMTGAGKTTVTNLLTRLYDFDSGQITIDGYDIRSLPRSAITGNIAYIQQDMFLFAGSILENIRLRDTSISREDVRAAAEAVYLDQFVQRLPQGYDESVSEGGSNLSTGQKQLIAFARALVRKPSILVLDEATSNIDTETENIVQAALTNLVQRQTSLIIAHRLSTVRSADRILVIHKGELVEEGTHEQLLQKQGVYARLYQLQFLNTTSSESAV